MLHSFSCIIPIIQCIRFVWSNKHLWNISNANFRCYFTNERKKCATISSISTGCQRKLIRTEFHNLCHIYFNYFIYKYENDPLCITSFWMNFPHLMHFAFGIWIAVLLAVLSKPAMNEIFLILVSYVIILTFLAIEICIFFAASNRYLDLNSFIHIL